MRIQRLSYLLIAWALWACSSGPREAVSVERIDLNVGGKPVSLKIQVRTEMPDLPPLPNWNPGEGDWLKSTVIVTNQSVDTVRLRHADTGCLVKLRVHRNEAPYELLWENTVGCDDVEIAPVLAPGQTHAHEGLLRFVVSMPEPGVHLVRPSVEIGVATGHRSNGPWTDTLFTMQPVELEFRADRSEG